MGKKVGSSLHRRTRPSYCIYSSTHARLRSRARSERDGGTGQALPAGESPYPRANPAYAWRGWDGVCELEMVCTKYGWCVAVERWLKRTSED